MTRFKKFLLPLTILLAFAGLTVTPYFAPRLFATVNEVTARNDYTANGSTTAFTYSFRILTKTDIEILVNGVVKTVDTDYTVTGLGASSGGTVTFIVAPANGLAVTLLRKQPAQQTSVYAPNTPFNATRLEQDLDKLQMQVQQLKEQVQRIPAFEKKSLLKDVDWPEGSSAANRAKKYLRWNAAGTGLEIVTGSADLVGVLDDVIPSYTLAGLPSAGTAGRLARVTDSSTTHVAGVYVDTGSAWEFVGQWDAAGPYAIGGARANYIQWYQRGTFSAALSTAIGFYLDSTIQAGADSGPLAGMYLFPTLVERSAGTHTILAGLRVGASVTAGGAAVTQAATLYLDTVAFAAGTDQAATLFIAGPPTGGTSENYSLDVASGIANFEGPLRALGFPSAVGTGIDQRAIFTIGGIHTAPSGQQGYVLLHAGRVIGAVGQDINLTRFASDLNTAASGTHGNIAQVTLQAPGLNSAGGAASTNVSSLHIVTAPTFGTNRYALWVDEGITRLDGTVITGAAVGGTDQVGAIYPGIVTQASLSGTATNGQIVYCSDCTIANPCAGAGTGAVAKRLNGVWVCN